MSERRTVQHVQARIRGEVFCCRVVDLVQPPPGASGEWFKLDAAGLGVSWVPGSRVRLCEGLPGCVCGSEGASL